MLFVTDQLSIPLRELDFDFVRSSGPGGQNVNKVSTKAVMRWRIMDSASLPDDIRTRFVQRYGRRINKEGCLIITSQRFRDRGRNIADCIGKLREMLASVAKAPTKRKKSKPTKASINRRLRQKQLNADKKKGRRSSWDD